MKVTAVCMGREIGNYVVVKVSPTFATLEVEHGRERRTILADRKVRENGSVTIVVGGVKIQGTDYFVKPEGYEYDKE